MHEIEEHEIADPWYKGPIRWIMAIFLVLLMILWIVPHYGVKLDPEPSKIPQINEVLPDYEFISNESIQDYRQLVNPRDPIIKQTADRIASISCLGNKVCQAKSMYYFIRSNYEYIPDPIGYDYLEDPKEFLKAGGGDCESGAIALSSLLSSIGIKTELVFIPRHAMVRIKLDEALKKYKRNDHIYLDWTCGSCEFSEIPLEHLDNKETYLSVN